MASASTSLATDFKVSNGETPSQEMLKTTNSISQNSITWTFSVPVSYGQFANGDYFVIDPGSGVKINSINPASVSSARSMNGSMINPGGNINQGYDEGMYGAAYADSLNVALDINSNRPLLLRAGESLVSTRSLATAGARPQISDMAILTCLSSVPASGAFRPPYVGSNKTISFNISDINYSALGILNPLTGAPDIAIYETMMQKVWYEAMPGWIGQFPRATNHMRGMVNIGYSSDMGKWSNVALLLLQCNYTNTQKKQLLIYMLQYAIDISGCIVNGVTFTDNGGHGHGRKSILALGAAVFNNSTMIAQLDHAKYGVFGEDTLINAVTSTYYSKTACGYNGTFCSDPKAQYNSKSQPVGTPEWTFDGTINSANANRQADYRDAYGNNIAGMLSALIMGQEAHWNRAISFDYAKRFRNLMKEGTVGAYGEYTPSVWVTAMIDAYWDMYLGTTSSPPASKSPIAPTELRIKP